MQHKVLVLGGYGNFGQRICHALSTDPDIQLLVAGRNIDKASQLANQLGNNAVPVRLDYQSESLSTELRQLNPDVLIHTSGPFQDQGYAVARACINSGVHYLDIADARGYVSGIGTLMDDAKQAGVLVVSGASSLPALSSAVVDQYLPEFSQFKSIRHGISSGAKPPGMATMRAVMSYTGKTFDRLEHGQWHSVYGWQDIHSRRYPKPVGRRWLASCDVPDLALFPKRYPDVDTVTFHAGLGFASTTIATWALSGLVRSRLIRSLVPYSGFLQQAATLIEPLGSRWSAMHVELSGLDRQNRPLVKTWNLLAGQAHGPNIPCFPAIAMARKLVRNEITERGAMPCMGFLSVDDILQAVPGLDLHIIES